MLIKKLIDDINNTTDKGGMLILSTKERFYYITSKTAVVFCYEDCIVSGTNLIREMGF